MKTLTVLEINEAAQVARAANLMRADMILRQKAAEVQRRGAKYTFADIRAALIGYAADQHDVLSIDEWTFLDLIEG